MKRKDVSTWDETFMEIAYVASKRSKDPSTQVGACVVTEDNRVLSIGYNGAPRGFHDDSFPWGKVGEDIDTKYAYVVHAEHNAILNYRGSFRDMTDATVYVTHFPCNECAKSIIQSGVSTVIYENDDAHNSWKSEASRKMLSHAGVTLRQFVR